MFDQYATHSKLVPENPLKTCEFGVFTEVAGYYKAADLRTFKNEAMIKFIYGERSMDEWDSFVSKYLSIGGKGYDDARNKVWQEQKTKLGGK